MYDSSSRRAFLLAGGTAALTTLAGCSDDGSQADPEGLDDGSEIDPEGLDDGDRPAIGDEAAPVTVAVFEDFGCPACRQFKQQATPAIVQQYVAPGDVRYLHADFPIPVDEEWSYPIASAARAVFEEAGNDEFWEFSTDVYDHQGSYSLDVVESVAEETAGVGTQARTAAEEETYRDRLEADRDRGVDWGVSGTPTVFVDDEQVDPSGIDDAIQSRL